MIPSVTDIRRALSDSSSCFDRLADVRLGSNEPVGRNTMFAEFDVEWQGGRWLLCTPVNSLADGAVDNMARMAARLRAARPRHLAEYRVFRSELLFADSAGGGHRCDVVMQLLPSGDSLDRCKSLLSREGALAQLADMQAEFARMGFAHNNLKPENIIVTPDGRFVAVRSHFARMGECADPGAEGNDGKAFEALRRYVESLPEDYESNAADEAVTENGRVEAAVAAAGCEVVDGECEQRITIRRDGLYGYADAKGEVVVEPKYDAAEQFREGRAKVEIDGRKGLIDKSGRWVIPARCEQLEYDDVSGITLLQADGVWSVADYEGRPMGICSRRVDEVCRAVSERMNVTFEL